MKEALYFKRLPFQKEQNLLSGIARFKTWLDEWVQQGISVLQHDPAKLDEIATRMVDMGLQGLARKLRLIPERMLHHGDWMDFTVRQIGEFYVLIKLIQVVDSLNTAEKEDVLTYCGIPFGKADFETEVFYSDNWLYLGTRIEKEEKLLIRRNWFYGVQCQRSFVFIEYQFNRFSQVKFFKTDSVYKSSVQFYPSAWPTRIKDIQTDSIFNQAELQLKAADMDQVMLEYSRIISLNPFIRQTCLLINQMQLNQWNNKWYVIGLSGRAYPISNEFHEMPRIVSYAVHPKTVFIAEYTGYELFFLSVFIDDCILPIHEFG